MGLNVGRVIFRDLLCLLFANQFKISTSALSFVVVVYNNIRRRTNKERVKRGTTMADNNNSHDNDDHNHCTNPSFLTALVAGGMAGTSVDVALYPIDTIKVRVYY